jgi:peroxiredoxin
MFNKFLLFLIIILFSALNGYCQTNESLEGDSTQIQLSAQLAPGVVGKEMPSFEAFGLDGKVFTNQNLKGKVTFISHWFTGCHPCLTEIPELNRLYNLYKDSSGFQFFAITFDNKQTTEATIKQFSIKYPVLMTSDKTSHTINFGKGYPNNMVIDSEGKVSLILMLAIPKSNKIIDEYFKQAIVKGLKSLKK